MKVGFPAREVTRLTGIPYSTLNLWAKKKLVEPSVSQGIGTGNERLYSFNDLVALRVASALRSSGVSTSSLKKVIEYLSDNMHMNKPLSEARLVVNGRDVAIVRKGELVSILSRPGQGYLSFVIDLPQMVGELVDLTEGIDVVAHGVTPDVTMKKIPRATAQPRRKQVGG